MLGAPLRRQGWRRREPKRLTRNDRAMPAFFGPFLSRAPIEKEELKRRRSTGPLNAEEPRLFVTKDRCIDSPPPPRCLSSTRQFRVRAWTVNGNETDRQDRRRS